jgi:hypothetical protein
VLPKFLPNGLLPDGVHEATWEDFRERFGTNSQRRAILAGIRGAGKALARAGCRRLWVDGSFVTKKKRPSDWDGCWDSHGVKSQLLDVSFLDFSEASRMKIKMKYQADLFPSSLVETGSGLAFVNYFQIDKKTNDPKGIVELSLIGWDQ